MYDDVSMILYTVKVDGVPCPKTCSVTCVCLLKANSFVY